MAQHALPRRTRFIPSYVFQLKHNVLSQAPFGRGVFIGFLFCPRLSLRSESSESFLELLSVAGATNMTHFVEESTEGPFRVQARVTDVPLGFWLR